MDRTAEAETGVGLDKAHKICRERRIVSWHKKENKTGNVRINVTLTRVRVSCKTVVSTCM